MFDHGFTRTMLAALFRAGLITTQRDAIGADATMIARIEITAAGRRALEVDRRNPSPPTGDFPQS
jgi:hypothetical protein